jgi:multiple sugar transport system substrate-binding protein
MPDQDRTKYAKQLDSTGQLPNVMIAVAPSGFAEAGKLYASSGTSNSPRFEQPFGAVDLEQFAVDVRERAPAPVTVEC